MTEMRYFDYQHLPPHLHEVSKPFHDLAQEIIGKPDRVTDHQEQRAGLRKLLEAKDCIVRSVLPR